MGIRDSLREILAGSSSSNTQQYYQPQQSQQAQQPQNSQNASYTTPQGGLGQQYNNMNQQYTNGVQSGYQQPQRHYLDPIPPARGTAAHPDSPNFSGAANLEHYNNNFLQYLRQNPVRDPNPQNWNRFTPSVPPRGSAADPNSPNFRASANMQFYASDAIRRAR